MFSSYCRIPSHCLKSSASAVKLLASLLAITNFCCFFVSWKWRLTVKDFQVKQLLAADGRLNINFEIASSGSAHNYTRSYYMNGRDYIISGSCDEHVVHICCAQTGRRLRDVHLEVTMKFVIFTYWASNHVHNYFITVFITKVSNKSGASCSFAG